MEVIKMNKEKLELYSMDAEKWQNICQAVIHSL